MSPAELIVCLVAAVIVIPMALLPFLVESGERDGIVKTGHGDDTDEA